MTDRQKRKNQTVAVIGIGRVGLPLALVLAEEGLSVYGLGRDIKKIENISNGKMPFLEKGAAPLLKKYVNKSFFPTVDYSCIKKSDVVILTLGTPVDENMNPILDQIDESIKKCLPYFKKNQILILRSTVSPRTTQYVKLLIEKESKYEIGKNFFLAFCPERISEGNSLEEIKTIPQIIGGVDRKSSKIAEEFFKKIGVETLVSDDITAELSKLFTNMYRYINFAIANEFMVLAQNYHRDIYEIVKMVNHNYKRGGISVPGLTAGPCLFKDGFFLISDLPYVDLISTSWKINEAMPLFLVRLIRERMKLQGKKTALLGLAFKAEIDDIRESLSFKVRKALLRERADLILHDPYIKEYTYGPIEQDVYKAIEDADLIFIATNHKEYRKLDIKKVKQLAKKNCLVCDVWNVFGTDKILFKLNKMNDEW